MEVKSSISEVIAVRSLDSEGGRELLYTTGRGEGWE